MSNTTIPTLLNEELIKRALKSYHKINNATAFSLKAYEYKLSPANGEHFCSEIYKVAVEYTLNGNAEQKSLIVKVVLPEEAALGSNQVGEHKEHELYVLENLNSLGYFCADRTKGLDLPHAQVLMHKIAVFHAASMLYAKNFPEVVDSLLCSPFKKGACDDISKVITYGAFEYVGSMIKNWPSYETLSEKIFSVIPKYNSRALEVVTANNSKFNVINHGDLWVNNFLYKHNQKSGEPEDVLFVDFQNCFWGSCGFDIVWLLNSSLELKVLKINRQELIQTYSKSLKEILTKINYPVAEIPTFEDVSIEIRRCEFIGFYISLCEFPFYALERRNSKGLDSSVFTQPEEMKKLRILLYENPRVQETLKYCLKYFDEINLF